MNQHSERQELKKQVEAAKKSLTDAENSVLITMIMDEQPKPRDTFILTRGEYDKHGDGRTNLRYGYMQKPTA